VNVADDGDAHGSSWETEKIVRSCAIESTLSCNVPEDAMIMSTGFWGRRGTEMCNARCGIVGACLALLSASALLGGCASRQVRGNDPALTKSPVSVEQEDQIGGQVKAEIDGKHHLDYLQDPEIVAYVRGVAAKVVNASGNDWSDLTWQIYIIDDARTVTAFATPGGQMYVSTALLVAANDEAEMAGVIGHVLGHMVAHHPVRNLISTYGLDAITALAAGQNPGLLNQLAGKIGDTGLVLAHTQQDESEADELGARYASGAGYDPRAIAEFFEVVQLQQATLPGAQVFLTEHPTINDRRKQLEGYVATRHLVGTARAKAAFTPIKEQILAHAAGPSGAAAVQALENAPPPPPPGIRPASTTATPVNRKPPVAKKR
jgi:predicted Zn-dependent protease